MLVEFALIAIAFYMLMAGTIEVGRMIFSSQLLQNAARVGARELAMLPLPATYTFNEAMADPNVKEYIYDPALLVWEIPPGLDSGQIQDQVNAWPAVNRMLYPLMIQETANLGSGSGQILRYPGALVMHPPDALHPAGFPTVAIPQVVSRDAAGVETIRWHDVVEEVVPTPPTVGNPDPGPFSMASGIIPVDMRGLVALRINFPYQASTLSAYQPGPTYETRNQVVLANDAAVQIDPNGPTMDVDSIPPPNDVPSYAGKYGLGKLYALGAEVRPFNKLLTAQSIFRREVFK